MKALFLERNIILDNSHKIKLLSLLRVINHTLRRTKDEKIIKSALDSIEELIKDINDLNLE